MKPSDLPVVGDLLEAGAEDRVFDSLLLAGPIIILIIAVVGREPITTGLPVVERVPVATGLAVGYVVFFTAYVLYRGVRH